MTSILNTFIEITVIKNISTITSAKFGNSILSPVFTIPIYGAVASSINLTNYDGVGPEPEPYITGGSNRSLADFKREYNEGRDASFQLKFANNIEIEHNYKDLTKRCKITLPRALNKDFKGQSMIFGNVPMFGRGDRIIVRLGYNGVLNTIFLGYITKVGITTPLQIECEDMMFFLKNCSFFFSPTQLTEGSQVDRSNLMSGGTQISINSLVQCALTKKYNSYLNQNPGFSIATQPLGNAINTTHDIFFFNQPMSTFDPINYFNTNIQYGNINVFFDNNVITNPITYSTKQPMTIAEFLADIKKKFPPLVIYFDDFINLRIGLEFSNSGNTYVNDTPVDFLFEGQIIDESGMKLQRAYEKNIKIVMKSKPTNKLLPTLIATSIPTQSNLGYYGSPVGTIINVNCGNDIPQEKLNNMAALKYNAEVYDGWEKGSSFVTFGTPIVHIGNKIKLTSILYPEKNGIYVCDGVKTTMGLDGYRQIINVTCKISN